MRQPPRTCLVVLLLSGLVPTLAAKEPARRDSLDRLLDTLATVRRFPEVALAPDGRTVAWVESLPGRQRGSAIFVLPLGTPEATPRRVTAGDGHAALREHGLAWSPDGRRLAFLSDQGGGGQPQVYVAPAEGGRTRKLTGLAGRLADLRWSPAGTQLALLRTPADDPNAGAGPTAAAAPEVGVVGTTGAVQRLHLIDAESGKDRPVSPAELHVYEYAWSPDGGSVVAVAAPPPADDNWYVARMVVLRASDGVAHGLTLPPMQLGAPCWSPDGKSVAFVGGLMSDEGVLGGDVWVVPSAGGTARNLTPGLKASASRVFWLTDPDRVVFTGQQDGGSVIAEVDPASGKVRTLWHGDESIGSLSLARDGKVSALTRTSFAQPPEVWAGPVGGWRPLTRVNRDAKPAWGEARSLHWKSDSWRVQGWLLYPRDFDPGRRYPMVVSVHGGPASSRRPSWPGTGFDLSVLADRGYFVLFPNPRGSYGQGEAFTRANVRDFGHGDLRDVLAGVDEALRVAPIDRERVGVAGWSYGGYMTMWAVTQTNRFRAAVAGAGIANWQSYYGQNGIDQWLLPYFGASVYDDPSVYARSSPITFITQVRTPTLVLVGERDAECPAVQSREFWHALRERGVPTQLVVYPGEGHGIRRAEHRRDVMRRTADWLDRYLRPSGASPDK
jgi:dipeptidyl aminopeptidase/acylaminoacyl peptidase